MRTFQQAASAYNGAQRDGSRTADDLLLTDRDLQGVVRMLCDQVLARYLDADPAGANVRAVGDRTPEHANTIPVLRHLYPDASFIHVIRDGRDGAVSGWAHLERRGQADRFASFADYATVYARDYWRAYILAARSAAGACAGYVEVRYEDLHTAPIASVRTMLAMLGMTQDDATCRACVAAASFERLSRGRSRGEEDRASHFRKGVVGDWRTTFDDAAERAFEAEAGDLLRALGYTASPVT